MKNILKNVFVIIGTIIGAGFASGKEVYIFFSKYGFNGLIGILISTGIFFIVIWKVLEVSKKQNIKNYNEIKMNSQIKHIMTIFLLTTFYIMIAGFSAFINQEFDISIIIGSIIIASMCYITFTKGVDGIVKVNTVLIPVLIIVLIHTCYKNVDSEVVKILFETSNKSSGTIQSVSWIISCLQYVGYNSIILIPILLNLKKEKSKYSNMLVSLISSIIFGVMAVGIHILLLKSSQSQLQLEIPIIGLISNYGKIYKYIFQIIIVIAIYTSAISAGYGFIKSISNGEKYIKIICMSSIFISFIGFTYLVQILYPVFGILGLIQIYFITSKYNN